MITLNYGKIKFKGGIKMTENAKQFNVKGEYTDTIRYADGTVEVIKSHNLIVDGLYKIITSLLSAKGGYSGLQYSAVGSGNPSWDSELPNPQTSDTRLTQEIGRKKIQPSDFAWVNASGVSELYKEYGGFQSIKNLQKIGDTRNFLSYVDNLKKHIIVENLKEKRHFDIYEPIEYKGKIVKLSDSLPLMSAYDFHNLIQLMFNDLEVEIGNKDLVFEDLFFTDQELQDKIDGKKLDTSEFDIVLEWEENGDSRYLQNFF